MLINQFLFNLENLELIINYHIKIDMFFIMFIINFDCFSSKYFMFSYLSINLFIINFLNFILFVVVYFVVK